MTQRFFTTLPRPDLDGNQLASANARRVGRLWGEASVSLEEGQTTNAWRCCQHILNVLPKHCDARELLASLKARRHAADEICRATERDLDRLCVDEVRIRLDEVTELYADHPAITEIQPQFVMRVQEFLSCVQGMFTAMQSRHWWTTKRWLKNARKLGIGTCDSERVLGTICGVLKALRQSRKAARRAALHVRRRQYPRQFGRRLWRLVASLPPAIRRLKTTFPLLPIDRCLRLARFVTEEDHDDVQYLLDAAAGRVGSPRRQPKQLAEERPTDPDDVAAVVEAVLDEISAESLAGRITLPIDVARAAYVTAEVTVDSHEEFMECVSAFHLAVLEPSGDRVATLETLPATESLAVGTPIGTCTIAGRTEPVCIPIGLRNKHTHLIGSPGSGKSTTIESMVLDDVQRGHGVAVIDPHGDLVERLLTLVPKKHADRVIYMNPGDSKWVPIWNPLCCGAAQGRDRIADTLVSALKGFVTGWGDRLEHLLRHAFFAVLHLPRATLLDVSNLLRQKSDESRQIRGQLSRVLENEVAKLFWREDFDRYRAADLAPPQHKLSKLLAGETAALMLSQPDSAFTFRQLMDEGKILLVDLAHVGPETTQILGCFMLSLLHITAFELGCKGITVYREGARAEQTFSAAGEGSRVPVSGSLPRPRRRVTTGRTSKFRMGCGTLFVTVNRDEAGLCEVFANLGKAGGCPSQSEATCRATSVALRSGVDPKELAEQLRGIRCLSAATARKRGDRATVLSCPDAIARALEEMPGHFSKPEGACRTRLCQDCGRPLQRGRGCFTCRDCGYSDCK